VCGGRVVDLSALQAATQYDDGYSQHSAAIRWFWEVRYWVLSGPAFSFLLLSCLCAAESAESLASAPQSLPRA
jgi:hypothetical protein